MSPRLVAAAAAMGIAACSSYPGRATLKATPTAAFPITWDQTHAAPPAPAPPAVAAPPAQPPPAAVPGRAPSGIASVAVLPLQSKGGARVELVEVLDDLVVSAMQNGVGTQVRVIGKSDIDAMLGFEKTKDILGCSDIACAVDMAGALGVDSVLSASAGALGSKLMVTLVWISQRQARILARISQDLGGNVETFDQGVQQAVTRLIDAAAAPGP